MAPSVTVEMPQNNSGEMGTLTIPVREGDAQDMYDTLLITYRWVEHQGRLNLPVHIFIMNGSVTVGDTTYERPIFMFDQTKFTITSYQSFNNNRDGFVIEFFTPYEGEIGGRRRVHKKRRTHKKRHTLRTRRALRKRNTRK